MTATERPELYFAFAGEVTASSVTVAIGHLDAAAELGVGRITVAVQSPGGDIGEGMRLYKRLRSMGQLPCKVVTHAIGVVGSMGIPIFLAGDTRVAEPQSLFALHRPGVEVEGIYRNAPELRAFGLYEEAETVELAEQKTRMVYQERTPLTQATIDALKAANSKLGAHEAVLRGIAHQIGWMPRPQGQSLVRLDQP